MPAFIGREELATTHADLRNLHDALESLPDVVFGGDLAAFGHAVGLSAEQVRLAVTSQAGRPLTRFTRADLYGTAAGFRLLEYNVGTQIGCMEQSAHVQAALTGPLLADFAAEHRLGYVDTMTEYLNTMFAEAGIARDAQPVVGFVDWPKSYWGAQREGIELSTEINNTVHGIDSVCGHVGELEYRGGRVWLHGRRLDIVYRIFMLEHVVEPGGLELIEPLVAAEARGEVVVHTPIGCEAFATKAALGLLSEHCDRRVFTPEQEASIGRILPWSRITNPGTVVTPDGDRADLLEYALAHREELALKATLQHGGWGITLGWEHSDDAWRDAVHRSMDGTFLLQQRIRPLTDAMPGPDGERVEYLFNWGMFTIAPTAEQPGGYGGTAIRCAPVAANVGVIGLLGAAPGALFAGTMHEL
ncbi:MAG TPA: hypothetical protein VGD67_29085 [Pseudonocardiaceae bacterium]